MREELEKEMRLFAKFLGEVFQQRVTQIAIVAVILAVILMVIRSVGP